MSQSHTVSQLVWIVTGGRLRGWGGHRNVLLNASKNMLKSRRTLILTYPNMQTAKRIDERHSKDHEDGRPPFGHDTGFIIVCNCSKVYRTGGCIDIHNDIETRSAAIYRYRNNRELGVVIDRTAVKMR